MGKGLNMGDDSKVFARLPEKLEENVSVKLSVQTIDKPCISFTFMDKNAALKSTRTCVKRPGKRS